MNKWVTVVILLVLFLLTFISVLLGDKIKKIDIDNPGILTTSNPSISPESSGDDNKNQNSGQERISIVAQNLETPWALAFLPNGNMLVTERPGRIRLVTSSGLEKDPVATLSEVKEISEGGLLGIAVHPQFSSNKFVYVYYTYSGSGDNTLNRVVRYVFDGKSLEERKVIVDAIPGAPNHDGGRIKFGPDGFLYITTGDSQEPSLAQDRKSLAGKILRVTGDGDPAPGNPFGTRVYSYGHRNPQGLTWDDKGRLWSTEHGRSGVQSGMDELNLIEAGKNYGWDIIQGDQEKTGMVKPVLHSGTSTTWAPSGAAFYNGSVFFSGLRGQGLYEAIISGNKVTLKKHFDGELGRIREVILGPDNMLYITTSNRDGRGSPKAGDDKILRVNPTKL